MNFDLVVVGGGPAGMMAAGRAASLGLKVILLEKNNSLGIKLLITGKERCNITNSISDKKQFVTQYGPNGKFLFSAIFNFDSSSVINFFEALEVKTKIEADGRVFPKSDNSREVLDALRNYLISNKVVIKYGVKIKGINRNNNLVESIKLSNGTTVKAKYYLLATGGKSYPATGSTGDAYQWLKSLGHKIVEPKPSLTPIICEEKYINKIEGTSISSVKIDLLFNTKKLETFYGAIIFTANGLSGPAALNLSRHIDSNRAKKYQLQVDLIKEFSKSEFEKMLIADFHKDGKKQIKKVLAKYLPSKMIQVLLEEHSIDGVKNANSITLEERKVILEFFKSLKFNVSALQGFEKAIVTRGGVMLSEVDPKTMQSKIIDNLFFAGELLDIDGPTGGFNLQICWSTGYMAGQSIASRILKDKME
jgi:predicted Rossmann fold flavoprotein